MDATKDNGDNSVRIMSGGIYGATTDLLILIISISSF